jgi:hypothetical protein
VCKQKDRVGRLQIDALLLLFLAYKIRVSSISLCYRPWGVVLVLWEGKVAMREPNGGDREG